MQGQPFAYARSAVRELIGRLGEQDRFALVSYASDATTTIHLGRATPEARRTWLSIVDRLQVGGGTNMSAGLDLAISVVANGRAAGRSARVILLSDGHANEGDASLEGLRGLASGAVAGEFVMSTVGVGEGFDESLMTALSDAGTGNFYYLRSAEGLGDIFALEFASARETVASALRVDLDLEPGVELLSAAGYPLERSGSRASFRPGALFAGQERRIWIGLRVPVLTGADESPVGLARVSLSYRDETAAGKRRELAFDEMPAVACVRSEKDFLAGVDEDVWAQSVAVDAFNALKQSVAADVQAGRGDQALQRMSDFVVAQEQINRHVQSPRVDEAFAGVAMMKEEVSRVLRARPAAAAPLRNQLGKQYSADAYDARRAGAKHE
jgi:Ca-activated chloride channel family protein